MIPSALPEREPLVVMCPAFIECKQAVPAVHWKPATEAGSADHFSELGVEVTALRHERL
jgi:hypothetical protein